MMNQQAKYIVIDLGDGIETPIIFPDHLTHAEVAQKFVGRREGIISAGFCQAITENKETKHTNPIRYSVPVITAWGASISLKLKCREKEDKALLNKMMTYQE